MTWQIHRAVSGGARAAFALAGSMAFGMDAGAVEAPADSDAPLDAVVEVVVSSSRNRIEQNQDVPLPTSVVGSLELERDNASTASDFARKLPSVSVIQNQPRQSSFAVRGIGKNQNQEAYEGSVGVIIDNVYTVHPGASWGNFFDLDRIEVARGPQGTLLGKNTTMGVVNIATRLPGFDYSSGIEATVGNRDTFRTNAYATGPLIDELLAFRLSGGYETADGPVANLFRPGETLNDLNRYNARAQLLFRPLETFSARVSADYARSAEFNGAWYKNFTDLPAYTNGVVRARIPPSGGAASGVFSYNYSVRAARFGSRLQTVYDEDDAYAANDMGRLVSESKGGSLQVDWDLGGYRVTSISATRNYLFKAHNDYDTLDTGYSGGLVHTAQTSQELRLTSPLGPKLDYQLGAYYLYVGTESGNTPGTHTGPDSGALAATSTRVSGLTYDIFTELNKTSAGRALMSASLDDIYTDNRQTPRSNSLAYYGQANWHVTGPATLTFGLRYTDEKRNNSSESWSYNPGIALTAANFPGSTALERTLATAIRTAQVRSTPFIAGRSRNSSLAWLVNPSFRLNDDSLLYASAAYGEKSSAVQFLRNNTVVDILDPERVTDYELGVKSTLFDRRVQFNLNLFYTRLRDFQTTVYQPDPTSTSGYSSFIGNAELVTSKGVEFDIDWALSPGWRASLTGAWNPARYADYPNGSCPVEIDPSTVPAGCNLTGQRLGGSSDETIAIGLDYSAAAGTPVRWHAFANNAYRSRYDASPSLSFYGDQGGFGLVDAGVGASFQDGRYDLTLLAKNLLDKRYLISVSDFSNSGLSRGALGLRRFVGLTFRAKLDD